MIAGVPQKQWTAQQNIAEAAKLKEIGNKRYAEKIYKEALRAYHKAILHLAGIIDKTSSVAAYSKTVASEEITQQSAELKFSIYMNMAQIYINESKFDRGLDVLAKAAVIKTNAKMYYRKGICQMKSGEINRAKEDFKKVVELDPTMQTQIDRLSKQMREIQKKQDQKSKNVFQKFFK